MGDLDGRVESGRQSLEKGSHRGVLEEPYVVVAPVRLQANNLSRCADHLRNIPATSGHTWASPDFPDTSLSLSKSSQTHPARPDRGSFFALSGGYIVTMLENDLRPSIVIYVRFVAHHPHHWAIYGLFFFCGFGPIGAPALLHSPKPPTRCSTFCIPMSASVAAASTPRQSAWQ